MNPQMSSLPEYLTVAEVADLLKMSPAWVRKQASGKSKPVLQSAKCGKCHRFRREAVEEFLKALEAAAR